MEKRAVERALELVPPFHLQAFDPLQCVPPRHESLMFLYSFSDSLCFRNSQEKWATHAPLAVKVTLSSFEEMLMLLIRIMSGRHQGGLYEPVLADSEREAVSDLLQYLENVR